MIRTLALAAALCAASPALAGALPPAAAAPQPDARYDRALAFIKLINSPERVLAQTRTGFFQGFHTEVDKDPNVQALEAAYPGIIDETADAMYPVLEKLVVAHLPELWDLQAKLLAERMTDAELADCIAFLGSPQGLRMIDALAGALTGDNISAELRGGQAQVTGGALQRDIQAAAPAAVAALSAADQNALVAFSRTAGGKRLLEVNPEMIALMARWMNNLLADPALKDEMGRVARKTIERRMAQKK